VRGLIILNTAIVACASRFLLKVLILSVSNGGGTAANPSYRFRCIFHGIVTKNNRKLENRGERDEESRIVSKRSKTSNRSFSLLVVPT